ncbi:LysR family transcriptional regulator [Sorangium sp. So ce542]|uniref:LysR family transcriptional regulator n=1 Tax=Sorangium sp. So ce542 TaxID=3133316 RepID=UPI003F60834B
MAAKSQDLGDARWDDIRIFLALHRHGSLGQAGVRLGLDTSTVSRRLTALEATLGARLFDRTREGLVPTRVAELVLPAAEAMEAAHRRLARDASGAEADAEGVVRLSVAPGFADSFVVPTLARLRARHPGIRIELDASVRVLDLTRREADLALRSVRPEGADLVATKLASGRWVAAASAELARDAGRVEAWDALPWITWDRDLASFPPALWLARHAPGAEIVLRTSFFRSQITAAELGLGAVLVPEPYLRVHALAPLGFAGALEASAAEWPIDHLWLVGHRALREVPRVSAVWSFLVEELRSR